MKVLIPGGEVFDLGTTETNPTVGITDYSRRVTDDYGVTTVVERGFSRKLSVRLGVPIGSVDAIQRKLAALRATAAQWVANERFACLSVNGFFKDFDLDLNTPPISYCTLTVEGLLETEPFTDPGGDPAPGGQASTLKLLQPSGVTDTTLIASNVPETDYLTWAASTSYALGARVLAGGTHRIYESTVVGNVGNDPTAATGKWSDIGPTNRWAMFDQALGSTTDATGSIAVTVDAAAIGAVALLDVVGATVRVQATGYDRNVAVGAGAITFLDLPAGSTRVSVTIAGSGAVSIGTLLIGKLVGLGLTESSPTAGITDYSRKDVDDFGAVTIVERAWAKRMAQNALVDTAAIDAVFARLAAVRATPSLWIGQDGFDSLTIYGFFKEFTITPGEAVSKLALSIEGLSTAGKVEPFAPGGGSVDWPNVGDPDGTKPADNATNGADPNSPLGSTTVGDFERQLAAARALLAYYDQTVIPTINNSVTDAGTRIDAARKAASDALATAVDLLNASDAKINKRIDSVAADGGYDDTNVYAEVSRVDQTAVSRDGALGQRIDTVTTNYQDADTKTNARVEQVATSASSATQAVADLSTSVTTRFTNVNTSLGSVSDRVTTLSTNLQGFADRTGTLEASVGPADSSKQPLMARVATAESAIASFPGSYAAASRATALEAQVNGTADSRLLGRANDQASVIADAKVGVVAQSVQTLSASIGGYNLLANTTFVSTDGWTFSKQTSASVSAGTDAAGDLYHPPGEHVLSLVQGDPAGANRYCEWQSPRFPVSPSKRYQYYAFANSHRCDVDAFFVWFDTNGNFLGATPSQRARGPGGSGNTEDGYTRIGQLSAKPIAGAVSGALWLRKYDTDGGQTSSYAWFRRPYVAEVREGQNSWNPFTGGTGASLEASVVQQAGVLAGLDDRTSVYWSVTGTTPDGSTKIQLIKSDGSAGLFYIGANLLVDGNAIFNGTVTIRALDRSTMTATTSGSVSGTYGGAGQAAFAYIPNLGADMAIKSGGSIYLTFTGNIAATTDATGSIYASFEILNAADNSLLASVRLPTPGFGPGGRLDAFSLRILNVWGDVTIRWRVATRATSNTWSIVQNPQCSVYWTAL